MTGGQLTGPQMSGFMLTSGTRPDAALVANTVGRFGLSALAAGTVHFAGNDGFFDMQSGTLSPMSGDSLMATTEMWRSSSWSQYASIPAPISCWAAAPPLGCLTVARPGQSLVITTSGRIFVMRPRITAAPQEWQDV